MSATKTASAAANLSTAVTAFQSLAGGSPPPELFYEEWLKRVLEYCRASGGRIRRPSADGSLTIGTSIAFDTLAESGGSAAVSATPLSRYEKLLWEAFATGRSRVVPPRDELGDHADANPTSAALFLTPLRLDDETRGVLELIMCSVPPADEFQDLFALIETALRFAAGYERRRTKHTVETRQAIVDEVERFTRAVHEKLSLKHVAYTTANDGRRLIGCDRVSLLIRRGNRWYLIAVSGLEVVEDRSKAAKDLKRAAAVVAETRESVWYDGNAVDLAPQVREALSRYVDEAHIRLVGIVPLVPPFDEARAKHPKRPLGALVVEHIDDMTSDDAFGGRGREERAKLVALHSTAALTHALEHESIPLLPLWRSVASLKKLFAPGTRLKTITLTMLVIAAAAALKLIPADLALSAPGTLQPAERRHCFAPLDGTIHTIHVRHGQRVAQGQLLLELRNTDLDVALADALGKRTAAADQLLSIERALFEEGSKLSVGERHRLAGQRSELKQELTSLDEQLRLLRRKREQLKITSPIAGEITTWNVEQLLANRPVRQGQTLLDVAETRGRWELELQVPEHMIAHLLRAQAAQGNSLAISYRLAADPKVDRSASVDEVHYAAEIRGDEGNTVLVRAAIADGDLPPLRPGAGASTKIYCGRRALGYVWLHDAVDFVHSKVLFRLY